MIKAIIFDCFGVLVEGSFEKFLDTYLSDKPKIAEEIRVLDHRSTEGAITYDEFLRGVSELSGMEFSRVKSFMELNPPNLKLLNYIARELKPKYKIGFLSNAADNWLDELFTKEHQALFDDFVLSYQHSVRKPDSQIFQLAAKRLGVDLNECILVDDVFEYCEGARAAGMHAVQYTTFEATREALARELTLSK